MSLLQKATCRWRALPVAIRTTALTRLRCFPPFRCQSSTCGMNFKHDHDGEKIEEETLPCYNPLDYYPTRVGEVLASKYRVVGKLGYGANSTVWLARDSEKQSYVAIKIYIRSQNTTLNQEVEIYKYLSTIKSNHPGQKYVRTCLDFFETKGPGGKHQCLVHQPLWQSLRTLQYQDSRNKLTEELLRPVLSYLLRAMDYLHSECHLVHTDIKASNIMLGLEDDSVLEAFERDEVADPSLQNVYPDRTVYQSRTIDRPKTIGLPILSDFGLARFGGGKSDDDIQPEIYRAPEILLDMNWTYSADIWNIGAMIWDIFYNKNLFNAYDPVTNTLSNKYHISEMVAYLGPPPLEFLEKSKTSWKYFDRTGRLTTGFDLTDNSSLESREEQFEGLKKNQFLKFIRSMLRWDPNDRLTAKQLLDDPWLNDYDV